ncbi:peptidyl-prolyl cis-trans isomerase C [Tropicimonas sediminicola]|uniref:Parvulin-like PPIase n=2 Tax=Tropicimonas sediminicola TaxID=1031541 RepID=A0A239L2G9_9RHOB|nr:peptidylprolyl isomerase [Tropicimonas sediminicola]SNT24510.1 peptidyl-prolyl cis-trans isomerase C [Tropicimonas sediminicola]
MRMTNKTWAAGLISLALSTVPAMAQDVTADTVVATVGGKDITLGHMIVARNALPAQYQQLEAEVLFQGVLDQLVQQTALAQSLGDDVTTATKLSIDNQTSGLLAGEALGKAIQSAVTEEALQAAYDARFADAEPETEFRAAHILVETEDEAKALKEELDGGADFAALARDKSTGPSGPNGGDLGWFGKGMMVPEFEAAVIALEPGQVSEPVQTQFGWHVVKLEETRLAEAPALDEVRQELAAEIEGATIDAVVTEVMEATEVVRPEVEIDPSAINNLDLVAE